MLLSNLSKYSKTAGTEVSNCSNCLSHGQRFDAIDESVHPLIELTNAEIILVAPGRRLKAQQQQQQRQQQQPQQQRQQQPQQHTGSVETGRVPFSIFFHVSCRGTFCP